MIDVSQLKGIIAAKNKSQRQVAEALGMTPKTFYSKVKRGVFDSDEIYQMIELLDIKNPMEVFFINLGACYAPSQIDINNIYKEQPPSGTEERQGV